MMDIETDHNELDIGCREHFSVINSIVCNYVPCAIETAPMITKIIVNDERPVYQRLRRLSLQEKTLVDKQIEELKKQLHEIRDAVTWLLDSIEVTNEGNDNNMLNSIQQEPMNITSPEVPTDNGVTKEFDPLRNSKEECAKMFLDEREAERQKAKQHILKAQQEQKKTFNRKRVTATDYKIGELVAIKITQFLPLSKLKSKFLWPYCIVSKSGPN
jgi:hypothetical protein